MHTYLTRYLHEILLGLLIVFSLILRIANFGFEGMYSHNAGSRLYLIANHIITYGELPLVGPYIGFLPGLSRSPLPYYFVSALLLVKNDILILALAGILMGVLNIFLVYSLARVMFGKGTALIAAILFSFSYIGFYQSVEFFWEPFIAQSFSLLSLLFIIIYSQKENFGILLAGVFILAFACAFYYPVLTLMPVIMLFVFYILKSKKKKSIYFLWTFTVFFGSLLAFLLPVLFYYISTKTTFSLKPTREFIAPLDFLPELFSLFRIFADGYFLNLNKAIFSLNNSLFLLIVGLFANSLFTLKHAVKKRYYFFIIALIFIPLMIASLLQINRPFFFDRQGIQFTDILRYFTTSNALLIILIADVISSTLSRNQFLRIIQVFVILTLIYVSFPVFHNAFNNLSELSRRHSIGWTADIPAVNAISKEVITLKEEERFDNMSFFQIDNYVRTPISDLHTFDNLPEFWVILERDLNTKLTTIDNKSIITFKQIGDDRIIFIVCTNEVDSEIKWCVDAFRKTHVNHSIIRQIYYINPYSIYVAKRY